MTNFSPAFFAGTPQSALREWAQAMLAFKEQGQTIYYGLSRPNRVYTVNGLEATIAAADPGAELQDANGNVGLTREGAAAARALTEAWMTFMETPIVIGVDGNGDPISMAPLDIISQR